MNRGRSEEAPQYVKLAEGCQPGWQQKVDSLLEIIMPCRCVACGLAAPSSGICDGCHAGLPFCDHACPACGLPLATGETANCGICQQCPPAWDSVHAAAWYEFPVKSLVRQFKFHRKLAAGRALTEVLGDRLLAGRCPRPDRVIPVPLHRWRLLRRGYNQAFEIARQLCRRLNLELVIHDLRRQRHTRQQAGLDAKQRQLNLQRAFSWQGESLGGKRVALVDDVMTTGSTVGECARVLRHAGASYIDVWVLARAPKPASISSGQQTHS